VVNEVRHRTESSGEEAGRSDGVDEVSMRHAGGPGSGNFGHAGRPGQVGGSGRGGPVDVNSLGFKQWFGNSKVVDEDGNPLRVYHGTTHNIESFLPAGDERLNIESDWGAGVYFTSDTEDVSDNYAGEGPDLTSRIEQRAEQIEQEMFYAEHEGESNPVGMNNSPRPEAVAKAKEELVGKAGALALPVYLSIEEPFVVGDKGVWLDAEMEYSPLSDFQDDEIARLRDKGYEDDQIRQELSDENGYEPTISGKLPKFLDALREHASDFQDTEGVNDFITELNENGYEGINSTKLDELWRKHEPTSYITDDNGRMARSELFRRALETAGFDGIIDHTVTKKFPKMFKGGDATHYIVFKPTQIKSAISNTGAFSKKDPLITMRLNPADAARLLLAAKLRIAGGPGSGNFGHSGGVGGPNNPGGSTPADGIASAAHLAEARVKGIAAIEKLLPQALEEATYNAESEDDEPGDWSDVDGDDQSTVHDHWLNDQYDSGDFQWDDSEFVNDAVNDLKHDDEFLKEVEEEFFSNLGFADEEAALPLEGESEDKQFDLVYSLDEDTVTYDADDIATLVDTDLLRFKNGKELSPKQIEEVERTWAEAYETKLENFKEDIYQTGSYQEASSSAENDYYDQQWSNMDDSEKLKLAAELDIYPEGKKSLGTESVDSEPDEWVTGLDSDSEDDDYNKTRAIANKLAELRTRELIVERELGVNKATVGETVGNAKPGFFVMHASGAPAGIFPTREEAEAFAKTLPNQSLSPVKVEQRISAIWEEWKSSSSNTASTAFQVMAAKELDGLHRFSDEEVRDSLRNLSAREQGILRAYARAQWETTQFILAKAETDEIEVFRGLIMPGAEVKATKHEFLSPGGKPLQARVIQHTNQVATNSDGSPAGTTDYRVQLFEQPEEVGSVERIYYDTIAESVEIGETPKLPVNTPEFIENLLKTTRVNTQTRLPDLTLKRNGLQSTTTNAKVANGWNGVDVHNVEDPTRVVLRARVPATSVISIPVFGQNIKKEQEVVVIGTKDRWEWDAWKQSAPSFGGNFPIKKLEDRVYKGLRAAMVTKGNTLVIDMHKQDAGKPHWLNIKARLEANRRGGLRTLGGPGSGNHGHAGRPGQVGGSAPSEATLSGPFTAIDSKPMSSAEGYAWHETGPVAAWARALSEEDREAISSYVGFGYKEINGTLRGQPPMKKEFVRNATKDEINEHRAAWSNGKKVQLPDGELGMSWAGVVLIERTVVDEERRARAVAQAEQIDTLIQKRGYALEDDLTVSRYAYYPGLTPEAFTQDVSGHDNVVREEKGFSSTMLGEANGRLQYGPAAAKADSVYARYNSKIDFYAQDKGTAVEFEIVVPKGNKVLSVEAMRRTTPNGDYKDDLSKQDNDHRGESEVLLGSGARFAVVSVIPNARTSRFGQTLEASVTKVRLQYIGGGSSEGAQ